MRKQRWIRQKILYFQRPMAWWTESKGCQSGFGLGRGGMEGGEGGRENLLVRHIM